VTRQALCVGGPPELHQQLAAAYAAADVKLRVLPEPLVGEELETFHRAEPAVDIFVWAAYQPTDLGFEALTATAARDYLERTIYSGFLMLQACLGGMERRRHGRILALTNLSGRLGDKDILASSMSGAFEGLIRSVAREGARKGVTANALQLGQIEGWGAVNSPIAAPFYDVFFTFREPFQIDDLARTVVELTTSQAGKLNGQVIAFDGGTTL
jgi:NAD(P)-dependent dehydrogenase (short-subunit alcohol dehydrogenase family)